MKKGIYVIIIVSYKLHNILIYCEIDIKLLNT